MVLPPLVSRLRALGSVSLIALASCEAPSGAVEGEASRVLALDAATAINVDVRDVQQAITGFGASSAWYTTSVTPELADFLFTPGKGIGLSMLRIRIGPDGSSLETPTAFSAAARGVFVWAAPWSPPGAWKTNGSATQGGSLKPEYYQAWADRLAAFAGQMKARGAPLAAMSAQNEPDWVADWETCTWTPGELGTFIRDHLAPALRLTSPETKIIAPEPADWNGLANFADPLLAEPGARDAIGVVAVHSYGGTVRAYPTATQSGKELWETEVSYSASEGISATLATARMIHSHLTTARVNAWHYWWINSTANTSLMRDGVVLPQTYGLAHFSKFVRPGFRRVAAKAVKPTAGVWITAFMAPTNDSLVLVAINQGETAVTQGFDFGETTINGLTPWITTEGSPLLQAAALPVEHQFEYELPPSSIVTFVSDQFVGPIVGTGGTGGVSGNGGATGGSVGKGGSAALPEAGANAGGQGGDSTASAGAFGAETGGAPSVSEGGVGSDGAGARPGSGGSPGVGGSVASSGGEVTATGGNTEEPVRERLPKQRFLPGCLCTTAGAPARSGSPVAPLLGAALGFVHVAGRTRRRRARAAKP